MSGEKNGKRFLDQKGRWKELAKYIKKQLKGCRIKGVGGEWLYIEEPAENTLEFWIQQFKTRNCTGHSEWSERFQRNIWIEDDE